VARLAIFASGNGTNFQAIAEAVRATAHSLEFLLCNKKDAFVLERALRLGVKRCLVSYAGKTREQAEEPILRRVRERGVDVIALAGFMKLLSPAFLAAFPGPILNVHPALLPRHAGVNAIERSFESGDAELGISVIQIDAGVDSGPILAQASFRRSADLTLARAEEMIHALEHELFPRVVISELDKIDGKRGGKS
jgi:phosphoribosylglycinamide formyltransferase-1